MYCLSKICIFCQRLLLNSKTKSAHIVKHIFIRMYTVSTITCSKLNKYGYKLGVR